MRVGHFSDLHGRYRVLDSIGDHELPDVWVSTGDFFPNRTRGDREVEPRFQTHWYTHKSGSLIRRLRGVPLLVVAGNHDYVDLAGYLRRDGYPAREVTPEGVELAGLRWAGFRQVPYMEGEWAGELHEGEFRSLVRKTFEVGCPDILVTHAPPAGILDGGLDGAGIAALTSFLAYEEHHLRHHFFGHVHEHGGESVERMGVGFHNSATCARIITI